MHDNDLHSIRRLPSGAIDTDYYCRRGKRLRAEATLSMLRGFRAPTFRLGQRIRAGVGTPRRVVVATDRT